jgi:hypothetical protein
VDFFFTLLALELLVAETFPCKDLKRPTHVDEVEFRPFDGESNQTDEMEFHRLTFDRETNIEPLHSSKAALAARVTHVSECVTGQLLVVDESQRAPPN